MPKYTKKNRPPRTRTASSDPDDSVSVDDGFSTGSNISDLASLNDDTETIYSTTSESILSSDSLDERLDTSIEQLRHKDSKTRESGLAALQRLFCQKCISDLITDRSDTLTEHLLACLRRGGESEGKLAAMVTSLFIVQLGESNDELFSKFLDALLPVVRDESKPASIRTHYAHTIGIVCFVASEDMSDTVELMKSLETIFSRSYLRSDGTSPSIDQSVQALHTAALSSWCLLMSTLPTNLAHDFIRIYAPEKIPGLLESKHADLRNQAGEAIAVLYEMAREMNSVFAEPPESLLILLDAKANESSKSKGKKEKRLQHATFREIYRSFETGTAPEFDVKFGRETLEISSWTHRMYYKTFSTLLAAGITVHMRENGFLRSVFDLEELESVQMPTEKGNRSDRHFANKLAFKSRTQQLRKTRDNKAVRSHQDD